MQAFYIKIMQAYYLEALVSGRDCELHVQAWRIPWVTVENFILSWILETNEFVTPHVEFNYLYIYIYLYFNLILNICYLEFCMSKSFNDIWGMPQCFIAASDGGLWIMERTCSNEEHGSRLN